MTCQECFDLVLEEVESVGQGSRDTQVHLEECEECRVLAAELRANTVALREMRDEVVPEQIAAVPDSKSSHSRNWNRWYGLAAAAILILAIGLGIMRTNRPTREMVAAKKTTAPRPEVAAVLPAIPQNTNINQTQINARVPVLNPPESHLPTQGQLRRAMAQAAETPVETDSAKQSAMKIVTADPNVVIYWLVGETQPQEEDEGEIL